MRITVLGAGAMGSLFGGYLSQDNEVWLVDVDNKKVDRIEKEGILICEKNHKQVFHPHAVIDASGLGEMDLVIVFVKAMYSESALKKNRNLIGKDTYLLTLQNGAGHEKKLLKFADAAHILIGSTQHNSSISANGCIHHGGSGKTSIGAIEGDHSRIQFIADSFTRCGLDTEVSNEVKRQIWTKLFLNTAASSLTAALQVPLGFIVENPYACSLMERLAHEAVAVANAECNGGFDAEKIISEIKVLLENSRDGYTSIYSDIKNGTHSEVDTISGAVVSAARRQDIDIPCHEFIVSFIHAMEDKAKTHRN